MTICCWNPRFDAERGEVSPDGDCKNVATVMVAPRTAKYPLCAQCADRDYFRLGAVDGPFRERIPIHEFRGRMPRQKGKPHASRPVVPEQPVTDEPMPAELF